MTAKKKVAAKKKVVAKKKVTKKVKDNFECAGPVDNTVTEAYVENINKGGYESFSYQRRAEDFVEENVQPVPQTTSKFRITIIAIVVVALFYLITH